MLYGFNSEKYGRDFETFSKAFRVAALAVAKFSKYYWNGGYNWYWPSAKLTRIDDNAEFVKFTEKELDHLSAHLKNPESLFVFMLDVEPIDRLQAKKVVCKFDHHDKSESWVLNLTEPEYSQVLLELSASGLPGDLFTEETN